MEKFHKRWVNYYTNLVTGKQYSRIPDDDRDLKFWQDQLFLTFLVYCLPVSLIALVPGVIMSIRENKLNILILDLSCLLVIATITFSHRVKLQIRKMFVIAVFYVLAILLIYYLGYIGPGVFYLFAITIMLALIAPVRQAYISIIANTVILLLFALVINTNQLDSPVVRQYHPGRWIAFSANLIFLSIVLVSLINRILKRLQVTIGDRTQLQERYRLIFDRSPMPMWLFDVETLNFIFVNEAAIRHYGYSKAEFMAMNIKDIRPPNSISELENTVKVNKLSKQYYKGTSKHIKKNGEYMLAKIESDMLELDGRMVRIVLATDITEQMEGEREMYLAQKKINESEANLKAIFESAADGFILLDQDFRIKAFNTKAKEYIRLNYVDITFEIGKSIFDFVEAARMAAFTEFINRAYNGHTIEYDRKHNGPGRSVNWIHYTLTPVYENNIVVGACIAGKDITAGKKYIQTIELQNQKFREISWIQSHLVRAPVARILALTSLITDGPADTDLVTIAKFLNESATELDGVIKSITEKTSVD